MLGLSGTMLYLYLCMRHLVISVLISLDQELSENIWFVDNGQRTTECEDRARILETEFAIIFVLYLYLYLREIIVSIV